MSFENNTPEQVFSDVLLEKLTSPGVIFSALSEQSPDNIFYAHVSVAFERWLELNKLEESEKLFQMFLLSVKRQQKSSIQLICTQAAITRDRASRH